MNSGMNHYFFHAQCENCSVVYFASKFVSIIKIVRITLFNFEYKLLVKFTIQKQATEGTYTYRIYIFWRRKAIDFLRMKQSQQL